MYPFARLAVSLLKYRPDPAFHWSQTHVTPLTCWPSDIDMFLEMNNGRILTLCEFGRFEYSARLGVLKVLRRRGWGLVVAGSSVRYRRRIRPFQRVYLHTRLVGWDARFVYFEQCMWRRGVCLNQCLFRTGVTSAGKLVPTDIAAPAFGIEEPSPEFPEWVQAWIEADEKRVWPSAT